jgi:hypothetical protein
MPTPRRHASHAQRQAAYRRRVAEARQREMTGKGMPPLPAILTMPGERRWTMMTGHALVVLQTIQEEMQEYYDQRSEQWQESERGETMAERLQALQEAVAVVEGLVP